jgi:uncharacterized protein with HEPN domain
MLNPDKQVRAYLWDIRDAAQEVAKFVRGVKFEEFEKNKILRYAVERQLHLIGGVAAQIPPKFREKHSEIDWDRLAQLRHMIEHQYGDTLAKRTWLAATEGLPEMMGHLEKLISA